MTSLLEFFFFTRYAWAGEPRAKLRGEFAAAAVVAPSASAGSGLDFDASDSGRRKKKKKRKVGGDPYNLFHASRKRE